MSLICKPFVFVRHGETPLNRDKLIGGRTDVPLTEEGERQARAAAPLLSGWEWNGVAVSSLQRARRTLELALPGVPHVVVDDLRERDWGLLENRPIAELPPYESTPPWGESWEQFSTRVTGALNGLLEQYDLPLIVAHSGVFRVIRYYASGTPYGDRVGNVVPMWISPGQTEEEWQIVPLSDSSWQLGRQL